MKKTLAMVAASAIALAFPNIAAAQGDAAPLAEATAHQKLMQALSPEARRPTLFAAVMRDIEAGYRAEPAFVEIEAACPGTVDSIMTEFRDPMYRYFLLEEQALNSRLLPVLREHLSDEQALEAAAFYSGELGQKLMFSVADNFTLRETVDSVANVEVAPGKNTSELAIDRDAMDRDSKRTAQGAVAALTASEQEQIAAQILGKKWFAIMRRISPEMARIRFEVANMTHDPDFEDQIIGIVEETLEKCEM